MRKVCLLGASGSIGTQTLDVMKKNPSDFELVAFSVGRQTRKIRKIVKDFPSVKYICVKKNQQKKYYEAQYPNIKFSSGDDGLLEIINKDSDMVVNALVGFVGLRPTLDALEKNKIVCLANKESLVVGGELVNDLLSKGYGKLYPIDSEHSALMKCLLVDDENVEKLVLTASGGAFRNLTREQLKDVTPEQALAHPTWKMGKKITIDCATMVNKTFEIIEAHYLFNYPFNKIGIKLHDESMIHSYVIYKDGTYRLDIGKPDMRNPIKLALYEFKIPFETTVSDGLEAFKQWHFHDFDIKRYPIVSMAELVMRKKGSYGAVFNAANEVAVNAFLKHEIPFLGIEEIIEKLMNAHRLQRNLDYQKIAKIDKKTRKNAMKLIKEWRNCHA